MSIAVKELKPVFTKEEITSRVREMGEQICKDYDGQSLVAVCVLKGAVLFFSDLVRALAPLELELDFLRVSSYGNDTQSSHEVCFKKDVELNLRGKNVLIIEDVIDSGLTMQKVKEHFLVRGAKSVKLCAFIDKRERRITDIKIDYSGFVLERGFIVGYGLDLAEKYRHLPGIFEAVVEESNV